MKPRWSLADLWLGFALSLTFWVAVLAAIQFDPDRPDGGNFEPDAALDISQVVWGPLP